MIVRVRLAPFALAFAAVFLVGRSLSAQTPPDAAVTAEALFAAGRADVERGDYLSACPKFADSQRLDPAPGTLINLADCEEHTGELARAWQHWREALQRLAETDARRPSVAARTAAIDARVPRLAIALGPGIPRDASIRRDDLEVVPAMIGIPVPLDPGKHTVVLQAKGYAPHQQTIELAEGANETVILRLGAPLPANETAPSGPPPTATPAPPSSTTESGGDGWRWAGYALVGVGVAGVGLGSVTGLMAIARKDEQEQNCFPEKVCKPEGSAAADEGRSLATVSTIAFVAGAALGAAGVYILLRSPGRNRPVASVTPLIAPGAFGIAARFAP